MRVSALSVAKDALPVFGFVGGSLSQLQSLVNTSFRVQHESGDWYLRVYNQHRRNRIEVESELLWMEALADAALAVPVPRRTEDDSLVWQSPTKLTTESYFVCVTSWLNGETIPGDKRNSLHYATLGRLLAQVHQHSISWKPPVGFSRPRCDGICIYRKLEPLVRQKSQDLDAQLKVELDEARNALLRAEKILKRDPARYGLVHGDPSFGNILFKDKTPLLLDFDDCGYGYFASDLAVVLAGAWGKTGYDENRSALLNGYQTERSLIDAEIDTLPIMMAARAASLILWAIEASESSWIEGQRQRLREYMAMD
jgi:Ser/Thr protein kinase RdoA (MazF antagonist)